MRKLMAMILAVAIITLLNFGYTKAESFAEGGEIYGIALDPNGNVIVTGSYSNGEYSVIRTEKYDGATGRLIWQKDYKQPNIKTNVGEAVAVDSDGNIYVGGIVGAGVINSPISSLYTDYIILKYNSNGNLLWHKTYNNHFADLLRDIAIDSNGNIYATGVTIKVDLQQELSNLNFWTIKVDGRTGSKITEHEYDHGKMDAAFGMDIKDGSIIVVGGIEENNISKFAVIKYDSNLNLKWQKFFGSDAAATDVVILPDGSMAVSGNKGTNFWTIMLDSNGNQKWDKRDGKAYNDYSLGIDVDNDGNIIVGCHVVSSGIEKWHMVKYGENGNVIWEKTFDINGEIRAIVTDGNDIIAAGYKVGGDKHYYLVIKYDENGNKIWESHVGNEPQLKADFSYYPLNPTRATLVHFNDMSTGATEWHWDFGDGTTSDARNPSHQYNKLGTYTVTLTVWDSEGNNDSVSKKITVINSIPTAIFSYMPLNPLVNQTITFDASGSGDEDGYIVNYSWDFGDGSKAYGKIVTHLYEKAGSYNVKLTVKDDNGATKSTSKVVTVNNQTGNNPPIAKFSYYPSKPYVDENVEFDAGKSYDEDGTIVMYKWDWDGDGKFDATYTQPTATYKWSKAGEYVVTLEVVDNANLTNTYSQTIEIKGKNETQLILTGKDVVDVSKGKSKVIKIAIKNGMPYEINGIKINIENATAGINITFLDQNITLQPGEKKEIRVKIVANNGGSVVLKAIGNGGISNSIKIEIKTTSNTPAFSMLALIAAIAIAILTRKWKSMH